MNVFSTFHEKLQDAIKKSPEWAQITGRPAQSFEAAPVDAEFEDAPF